MFSLFCKHEQAKVLYEHKYNNVHKGFCFEIYYCPKCHKYKRSEMDFIDPEHPKVVIDGWKRTPGDITNFYYKGEDK